MSRITQNPLPQVELGRQGLQVSAEGLGAMGMSVRYGPRDDGEAMATLNHAVDLGVTMIDTAEAYGPFKNERLLGRALRHRRDDVVIATKFGSDYTSEGESLGRNGRPEHVRRAVERSLRHLGVDAIDLYYLHRVDQDVPIEDTVGAMGDLVRAGKVRYIGLSEAAPATIQRAHDTFPLSAVQSEYSLFSRDVESNGVLDKVRNLGIGFVAFSPLGRGLLSGKFRSLEDLAGDDARRALPRFQRAAFEANLHVRDRLEAFAHERAMSVTQLALAWAMARDVVPIPGTKRRDYLEQNVAAAAFNLTAFDVLHLEELVPARVVMGARDTGEGLKDSYR